MKTLRLHVHEANIARYEGLLACDLTPYERRYLEDILEQERSMMRWMQRRPQRGSYHSATPEHDEPCDDARLVTSTYQANPSR